jgi:4-alpha-glucanotransferase
LVDSNRIRAALRLYDIVRIDHFRGFAGYWEVPASEETAVNGQWVTGPGADLFDVIRTELGDDLPIIAEDLGEITPDVIELRDQFELPGMKILQFAFSTDASDKFLPHNYTRNFIVYSGTHDNDTSWGWYRTTANDHERDFFRRYFRTDGHDAAWALIDGAFRSVANTCDRAAARPAQPGGRGAYEPAWSRLGQLELALCARTVDRPSWPTACWTPRSPTAATPSSMQARIAKPAGSRGRSKRVPAPSENLRLFVLFSVFSLYFLCISASLRQSR